VFVPGKPFQPSLLFVGKPGAYPRVEHPRLLLALSTGMRLGWEGLPGTNNPAYFNTPRIKLTYQSEH